MLDHVFVTCPAGTAVYCEACNGKGDRVCHDGMGPASANWRPSRGLPICGKPEVDHPEKVGA